LSLLPAFKGTTPAADPEAEEEENEEDASPRPPAPEPKVPLKGGLGDRERRNLFG
jgi:hypothetical protein